MILQIFAISEDCPNLINLAIGLSVDIKQPGLMSQVTADCCTAGGIVCDGLQRVKRIDWQSIGLDGTINETALPDLLTHLDLTTNSLVGAVPLQLPSGLLYLYIAGNKFTGPYPSFPSTILGMDLSRNYLMTCNIQSIVWPPGLLNLHINGVGCKGDVPRFPSSLKTLFLGWCCDVVPNKFGGTLFLDSPTLVVITNNLITNIVISNTTLLTSCDLSNNPLLGNPGISNYTMCTKNGLFNASLLPVSISYVPKDSSSAAEHVFSTLDSQNTSNVYSTAASHSAFQTSKNLMSTRNNAVTLKASFYTGYSLELGTNTIIYISSYPVMLAPVYTIEMIITMSIKVSGYFVVLAIVVLKVPWKREFGKLFRKKNKKVGEIEI